jgi:hypothetical protein
MADLDDIEQRLIAYIEASQAARTVLSELHGLELTGLDIQSALAETLNIPDNPPHGLLDQGLTSSRIVGLLRSFDFRRFHPEVLGEVTLDEPLIPSDLPRLLTEKTVKIKGEVWQVHKNDVDPFPSNPHAHNYDAGVVLDLGTGEMYDRNRKSLGPIGCKKLLRLRDELSSFALPPTDCA